MFKYSNSALYTCTSIDVCVGLCALTRIRLLYVAYLVYLRPLNSATMLLYRCFVYLRRFVLVATRGYSLYVTVSVFYRDVGLHVTILWPFLG
jgi:hypothetical protein